MEKPTHDALVSAIQTTQATGSSDDTDARLRSYGLSYEDIGRWVLRQLPTLAEGTTESAMMTGVLVGIELGRVTADPLFALVTENPDQIALDENETAFAEDEADAMRDEEADARMAARKESELRWRERMGDPDAVQAKRQRESAQDDPRGEADR